MKLPIGPVVVVSERVPLTQALQAVAVAALDGYVTYGVEVHLQDGNEPPVRLRLEHGGILGDALGQIFSQLPDYRFEILSDHLISVHPKSAKDDRNDPLNLRVPRFDVNGERSGVILTWPERFIPELKRWLIPKEKNEPGKIYVDLYVGSVAGGPHLNLHLVDVTVREILDETSKATERFVFDEPPTGWVYTFQPKPASRLGGVHSWRLFMTLPRNWLEQAKKAGNGHAP